MYDYLRWRQLSATSFKNWIMFVELDLAFSTLIYVSRATKYLKSILKH